MNCAREGEIARDILAELNSRLTFLKEVGLAYLSLDRAAPTLSGGEAQRIRWRRNSVRIWRGVCYILDEPTIGLPPRDNRMFSTRCINWRRRAKHRCRWSNTTRTQFVTPNTCGSWSGCRCERAGRLVAEGTIKGHRVRSNGSRYWTVAARTVAPSAAHAPYPAERRFVEVVRSERCTI